MNGSKLMIEMLTCMATFAVTTQVLIAIFHASYMLAAAISAIAMLVVEILPEPLNVFKWRDMAFGIIGILIGLYISGWRP